METQKPHPELRQLHFLTGQWNTSGIILGPDPTQAARIHGTDNYEWVSGGHFLLHRVNVLMGDTPTEAVELIGYDPETGKFPMRSFDDNGNCTTMFGAMDAHGTFTIDGGKIRATLKPNLDASALDVLWEQSEDVLHWEPWLKMTLEK
jgi:uncharacterized protein DUF1579